MRKFSVLFLSSFFTLACLASTLTKNFPKGCDFSLSYKIDSIEGVLTMTSGFYGEYCGNVQGEATVSLGNGDSMSWVTSSAAPSTVTYTYPSPGRYTVDVWLDGQYQYSFSVHIIDMTPCELSIRCAPTFVAELYYSLQKEEYSLTAIRTDTCTQGSLYWTIGGLRSSVDTLRWPFGNIAVGSLVNLCLHRQLNCHDTAIADTASCEQIVIEQEYATVVDPIPDSTLQLIIYPTNAENEIRIIGRNFTSDILLSIYSSDGRKILTTELSPTSSESGYTLDIETFPAGMYLVKGTDRNRFSKVQKLFKQ